MKKTLISCAVLAGLIGFGCAGYHAISQRVDQLVPSEEAVEQQVLADKSIMPTPPVEVPSLPFPEGQLKDIFPQINQAAGNITHVIDSGEAGQLGQIWDSACDDTQRSVSRDKFILTLEGIHQGLGVAVKRQYFNTVYKTQAVTGAQQTQQYVIVNYLTYFPNELSARKEAVAFVFKNQQWKLLGYSLSAS